MLRFIYQTRKTQRQKRKKMRILFLITILATASYGANIIQNPDFEDATAWTFNNLFLTTSFQQSGAQSALTFCVGHSCVDTQGAGSFISQTLNTTVNQNYDLTFWVTEDA